jgi:predicted DNA-binding transcriptional regulator YafY
MIDKLLASNKRYSIKGIAEIVNEQLVADFYQDVTERTIRNDIQDMEDIYGVDIKRERGHCTYIDKSDSIFDNKLTAENLQVLELALQSANIYKGTSIFEKLDETINNLMAGSVLRKLSVDKSNMFIQLENPAESSGHEWLDKLFDAIKEQRALKLNYQAYGDEAKERHISPYALKEYRGKWYVIAYSHKSLRTALYKLSRIKKVEPSLEKFNSDQEFDLNNFFKYSLGVYGGANDALIEVVLKFAKTHIFLIEENPVHPAMETLRKTDDELVVKFKTYDTIELKNLILSFGEGVTVMEPLSLRTAVLEYIERMKNNYK